MSDEPLVIPWPVVGRWALRLALVALVLGWVWFAPFSFLGTGNLALTYTLAALSLVVLTGWVGQISLAQASFVGVGAFATGVIVRAWGVPFPFTLLISALVAAGAAALLGVVALRVRGLYLAVATLIFAWMTQEYLFNQPWLAGVGGSAEALVEPLGEPGVFPFLDFTDRRTFYYMILAATVASIVGAANLRDSKTGRAWFAVKGSEVAAASLGVDVTRYKLTAFAVSGFIAGAAGNLVMTHQQVVTADSFSPTVSLFYLAIAVVGGLMSLGGAVAGGTLFALLEELFFRVEALQGLLSVISALLLAVVLLFFPDGLSGLPRRFADAWQRARGRLRGRALEVAEARAARDAGRAAVGAVVPEGAEDVEFVEFVGVESVEGDVGEAAEVAGDAEAVGEAEEVEEAGEAGPSRLNELLMAPVLAVAGAVERLQTARETRRNGDPDEAADAPDVLASSLTVTEDGTQEPEDEPEEDEDDERGRIVYQPGEATKIDLPPREEREPILAARNITVTFGGLTAVNDFTLEVRKGEIVGLIGPNGAGKTTLFNAISGLNQPDTGTVELFGKDISDLEVHERALRGMGRTFQVIQLFPQLDVFDNLLVATHQRNPSGFFTHLAATPMAVSSEAEARYRVQEVVKLLDLEDVVHRTVSDLPFGVLRLVEIARAVVTGSPFVMLDEPASGLDNAETDRFMDLLLWIRQTLGVTFLLIEHDVRAVTGLSDHMYVIDRGNPVANGTPAEIQRDEAVIAAYLGTGGGVGQAQTTTPSVGDASSEGDTSSGDDEAGDDDEAREPEPVTSGGSD